MKKTLALLLALVLIFALAACGGSSQKNAAAEPAAPAADANETPAAEAAETAEATERTTIRVAASPTPHAEILAVAKDILAAQGIDLEIVEYTDYVQPNLVVDSGELDANYFQHTPYLNQFNEENGTNVVSAGLVHYEPFGIFAGKTASIDALAEGAQISIPNDATNGARALLLLQQEGIITLKDGAGIEATVYDIEENPLNVEIVEMEAAQLPLSLEDVDLAVINGNYALDAGLNPATDALAIEDASGDAAQYFANLIGVKAGSENDPAILALVDALQSQEVADFINSTYNGAVVPIFDAAPAAAADLSGTTIRVAASPTPHAEILAVAKDILAAQGIDLEIVEYTDYVQPNLVVDSGELDANYFQHTPYLNQFNEENGTNVVSAGLIHYEPFGIFAGKTASIDALAEGAQISIPNDATNGARALLLLQQEGIITLKDGAGIEATVYDIEENPLNVEIIEMEAAQLPLSLEDVDLAVINGNYALDAGLNPATDALAIEDASGDAAQYFANLIGVKAGSENDPAILALVDALQSQQVKDFINDTYNGAVVPIF